MLYFAYGSNLLPRRLRAPERAPGARHVAVGRLRGWELRFHKLSDVDGSGKAGVQEIPAARRNGHAVWGALFELAADDHPRLDRVEGLGVGYDRAEVEIDVVGETGDGSHRSRRAFTYVARREAIAEDIRPYRWYRDLVIAGAEHHGFPQPYVESLRAVEGDVDPDVGRRGAALRILRGA